MLSTDVSGQLIGPAFTSQIVKTQVYKINMMSKFYPHLKFLTTGLISIKNMSKFVPVRAMKAHWGGAEV